MTFLPGKRYPGRNREHWRTLDVDVAVLRDVHKVDTFVLLVQDDELDAARVPTIDKVMARAGINLVRFPIRDGGVPSNTVAFHKVLVDLITRIRDDQRVVVGMPWAG